MEGFKLINAAQHLGIEFNAHNSMSDIEATREIAYKFLERIEVK